jgi:predicted RNA-binding protein associated with RNAse of E/G family
MAAFRPGDSVIVREVWRGKIWTVRALTVVRDEPGLLALYQPAGAPWKRPFSRDGHPIRLPLEPWTLRDDALPEDALRLVVPGDAHSVLLIWRERWQLTCWYINLEEPFRPTSIGFDYMDQTLDIVVEPDMSSWRWKDEDEFEDAIAKDIYSPEQARAIRAEGERALKGLLAREPPFDQKWEDWRADPNWERPQIKDGWEQAGQR